MKGLDCIFHRHLSSMAVSAGLLWMLVIFLLSPLAAQGLATAAQHEALAGHTGDDYLVASEPEARTLLGHVGTRSKLAKRSKPAERARQGAIAGTVTSAQTGEVLPGVNVVIEGTGVGSATDSEGQYRLTGVEPGVYTLVASFIGYADAVQEEVEVVEGETTTVDFALEQGSFDIDELIVVGYGTTRKENLTGSVSSVSGDDLQNIPAANVGQILQGRAAGVQVTQTSGAPGAESAIRIRGGNSILGDNSPLVVVDGTIMGSDFNLNHLDTGSIESIEVLKDATAVSIYGTRGANGVILVSTQSGAGVDPGRPQVTMDSYYGTQHMMNSINLLSGPEHAAYANEDAEYRNTSLPFSDPETVPDVDWVDQITRSAPMYNVDLSVAGQTADQGINYYMSGNYLSQEGLIRASGIDKYVLRSRVELDLHDDVAVGFNATASRIQVEENKVNLSAILYREGLPERAIRDENGNYTAINPVSTSLSRNPEADIRLRSDHNYETNAFGSIYVEAEPVEGLTLRSAFSPRVRYAKTNIYNPGSLPEHSIIDRGGEGRSVATTATTLLHENTLSYSTGLGDYHDLDLLGGFTWETHELEGVTAEGYGFVNDALGYNNLSLGSDPTRNVVDTGWDSYQLVSWLGRAHYSFRNRYLLTLVGRVDGSSRFSGSNNEYGFFPAVAAAWRLVEEPFIEELGVFDDLKLRVSYGLSGSQAIQSFRTLALLAGTNAYFNGEAHAAVVGGRPANENLRWETTGQLDVGLEASFFNDRLSLAADYYNKKTEDLLLNVQLPRQTGFTSRLENLGAIRNQGLELTINSVNISNDDFYWSSMLNLSGNRNEVLDLGGAEFIDIASPTSGGAGGRLIVGQPVPVFVGVEYLGTWKSQEEIDASGQSGQRVGGPRFKDTNDDGDVNIEDFEVLGSPQPDIIAGFQNSFSYKRWSMDVFIQGTYGNDVYNSLTQSAFFGRPEANKYAEVVDRWTPDNPDSDIPRAGTVATLSSVYSNSKMIEDGSHLRLKNVRLTYSLPLSTLGIEDVSDISVYFSGSNLYLLSNYRLFDPEVSQYGDSNTAIGFSQGEYPYGRTLTLGVRASF